MLCLRHSSHAIGTPRTQSPRARCVVLRRDEIAKFAPSLRVLVDHGSVPKSQGNCTGMFTDAKMDDFSDAGPSKLRDVDILLTAPTKIFSKTLWKGVEFHRMVMDEMHVAQNTKVKGVCSIGGSTPLFPARLRWGVTATTLSVPKDLELWASVLGQSENLKGFTAESSMAEREGFIAHLRKVMIRHTKSMRIGGAAALALPVLNDTTVWASL